MAFNKAINGYENEDEFVRYLNKKQYQFVHPIFQDLLKKLYPNIKNDDMIRCLPNFGKQKSDIILIVNHVAKRVSIKKGVKNSVHAEPVWTFIRFLKKEKVPDLVIQKLLQYHYADGTLNGSGKNRLSVKEYKEKHQSEIDWMNRHFNSRQFVSKLIDRFVLVGNNSKTSVDALIYGVVEDFLWATKEEIKTVILEQIEDYSTSVHFSCLTYQPMTRCLNRNPKYEAKRHYIQMKWYNIADDIFKIMSCRANGPRYRQILLERTEKYL